MKAYAKGAALGIALIGLVACGGDKKDDGGSKAGGDGDKPAKTEAGGGDEGDAKLYDASAHKGSLTGVVKFGGATIPEKVVLNVSSDVFCTSAADGKEVLDQQFQVNADGTVPHVFVYAAKGPHKTFKGYTAPTDFVLEQHGCMYTPHVFGVMVGQAFQVKNDDQTMHNVNVSPKRNDGANKGQPPEASDTFTFAKKEKAIPFTCDVHSWMSAKAWVMDHPFFATTDAEGKFDISGLPDGEYTFKAWHENEDFGSAEFKVTIAGGEVSQDVTLK